MTEGPLILAVDIGGTHIRIGATIEGEAVGEREKLSTDLIRVEQPMNALIGLIRRHCQILPRPFSQLVVGVPGFTDEQRQVIIKSPNVAQLNGIALVDLLTRAFQTPVWLEHDVTLRVRGEHARGSAKGKKNVLGIYFGTGIGAGFLKDGRPVRGGPFSMELGHIHIHDSGAPCGCGGNGCAEAHASGLALQRIAKELDVAVKGIFLRRKETAELGSALLQFLKDQAVTIAIAITLFDPDITVLGGGVVETAEFPHNELYALVEERLPPVHRGRHSFTIAPLGWQSVLYGALAVVNEHHLELVA